MPGTITRTLMLKNIEYVDGSTSAFTSQPLDEILERVFAATSTARERHLPELSEDELSEGTICRFIDQYERSRRGRGITFRYGKYVVGEVPLAMPPDLDAENAESQPTVVFDPDTGEEMQVVTHASVLIWNRVAIIESVRGAGGMHMIEGCLTSLIRRYVDPKFPRIRFKDVSAHEVVSQIARAGGVKEVRMDITNMTRESEDRFSSTLQRAVFFMEGATKLGRLILRGGEDGLPEEQTLEVFQEYEDGELDQVWLELKNGEVFRGDKLKVRKPVSVSDMGGNNPDRDSLVSKMRSYLIELRQEHDGIRMVDEDGCVAIN